MSFFTYLRRKYNRCDCDTLTSDNYYSGTTDLRNECPCTSTAVGGRTKKYWRIEVEREDLHLRELGRLVQRIKSKPNVPILPMNVINKTMQRRMMNGRK